MNNYSHPERQILLKVVDDAIRYGLEAHKILPIKIADYSEKLQHNGASFVTIEINKQLRGCIGTLEAYQSLIKDIAQNAYAAAYCDPRFEPLTKQEYPNISKHISVLSAPYPVTFTSEDDLLRQIRPGIDGLVLCDLGCRGTFLPSVWESLSEPKLFLQHLKLKAGLPEDYWSETIKVERYTVEMVE